MANRDTGRSNPESVGGTRKTRVERSVTRQVSFILANIVVTLALFEGLFALGLRFPVLVKHLPRGGLEVWRDEYIGHRSIVQYDPQCATFNSTLFYTLRPGHCTFTNREFSVGYDINSMGVRDDEDSLHAPAMIVLGDSQAMGWGVAQQETFGQVVERQTGLKVLNAAISSYGTAREMRLLEMLDTSQLKYLVIQYCDNDYSENRAFKDTGAIDHHEAQAYFGLVDEEQRSSRYTPLQYLTDAWAFVRKPPAEASTAPHDEVDVFLHTILTSPLRDKLADVTLVVFEINEFARNDSTFVAALQKAVSSPEVPPFLQHAKILDLSDDLTPDKYYVLDDHMVPGGHAAVAARLIRALGLEHAGAAGPRSSANHP